MSVSIVDIQNVNFGYTGEEAVLEDVSLDILQGDFIAMIGPNGGGKTTLLKLILGLLKPDKGIIRVMGKPALEAAPHIGYVPQDVHINRNFPITVIDVVMMGMLTPRKRWQRRNASSDRREALMALERMGIEALAQRKIGELSGGQRQRVFIARALVTKPRLMLLDEPTASIDTKGQADMFTMLKELNKDVTILVVSHDLLVISHYAKSVACVNRNIHYHDQAEITGAMLEEMYSCSVEEVCPVELVVHGLPHRVLKNHKA